MQKSVWIFETRRILVDERVSVCENLVRYQSLILRVGLAIAESLKGYWRQ